MQDEMRSVNDKRNRKGDRVRIVYVDGCATGCGITHRSLSPPLSMGTKNTDMAMVGREFHYVWTAQQALAGRGFRSTLFVHQPPFSQKKHITQMHSISERFVLRCYAP